MYSPRVQVSTVHSIRSETRQTNHVPGFLQQQSPPHSAVHTPLQSPRRQLAINQTSLTPRQFQQVNHSDAISRAYPPQTSPRVVYDRPNSHHQSHPGSHQPNQTSYARCNAEPSVSMCHADVHAACSCSNCCACLDALDDLFMLPSFAQCFNAPTSSK